MLDISWRAFDVAIVTGPPYAPIGLYLPANKQPPLEPQHLFIVNTLIADMQSSEFYCVILALRVAGCHVVLLLCAPLQLALCQVSVGPSRSQRYCKFKYLASTIHTVSTGNVHRHSVSGDSQWLHRKKRNHCSCHCVLCGWHCQYCLFLYTYNWMKKGCCWIQQGFIGNPCINIVEVTWWNHIVKLHHVFNDTRPSHNT